MKKNKCLVFMLLFLFCLPMGQVQAADTNEMAQYITEMVEEADLPGVMVTVVQDGKEPVFITRGYKDIETKEPITPDTHFELASNSKAYTGLALLYLEQQGKLSLDDSVTDYLPWFELKYEGVEQDIKIKDLLYQTTGINPGSIGLLKPDNKRDALFSAVQLLKEYETLIPVETSFLYATMNYDCIGLIIETVTGESYEAFMNETIFPLYGLDNTYAGKKELGADSQIATGYKAGLFGNTAYEAPVYRGNTPAGYVISSGKDIAKWLMLQLESAKAENSENVLITESQSPDMRVDPLLVEPYDNQFRYGAGWLVFDNGIISHGGNNPNYSSYLLINGEKGYAVGVLCNRSSSYSYSIAKGISDMLSGNEPQKAIADIYLEITGAMRIGLAMLNLLILWQMVHLLKRIRTVLDHKTASVRLLNKNRGRFLIRLGFLLSILAVPIVLVCLSMYSMHFLSVWLPLCLLVFLIEIGVLLVIISISRMIYTIVLKGDLL